MMRNAEYVRSKGWLPKSVCAFRLELFSCMKNSNIIISWVGLINYVRLVAESQTNERTKIKHSSAPSTCLIGTSRNHPFLTGMCYYTRRGQKCACDRVC